MRTVASKEVTKWYRHPNFIRPQINHRWTVPELKRVYTLRQKGLGVPEIIARTKMNVGKIQVYNVLRRMNKSLLNKCFQCGNTLTKSELEKFPHNPLKHCDACRKGNTLYKEVIRQKRKKTGICICCGKTRALKNRISCKSCLSAPYRHRIVKGFCGICGDRRIDTKHSNALCPVCLKVNRDRSTRHRKGITSCK